jgi:hypothetical protein
VSDIDDTESLADIGRRSFLLSVAGGLATLVVVLALVGLWFSYLDQEKDIQRKRVEACREITDPANRTLCIVESK